MARDVTQIQASCAGIGAGFFAGGLSQAVAQNVNQSTSGFTGIAAGVKVLSGISEGLLLSETHKACNLTQLGLTINQEDWTTGNDNQYPMLVDLDGGYQDMQRLSPDFMRGFAPPSNNSNASWFGPSIWRALKRLTGVKGPVFPEPAVLSSTPMSTPVGGCRFTLQSPGAIHYLLYDGQRYHGLVRTENSHLTYWITYQNGLRITLEPCEVYGFIDLLLSGVVVDAAVNKGNKLFVAYHAPKQPDRHRSITPCW